MPGIIGLLIVGVLMVIGGGVSADKVDSWKYEANHGNLITLMILGWVLTALCLLTIFACIAQGAFV